MDRVPLTAGDIVSATGGRLVQGSAHQPIERISIDSRTVGAGDFFVAIRGERFDGHDFVADAMARGALGLLVETGAADAARAGSAEIGRAHV